MSSARTGWRIAQNAFDLPGHGVDRRHAVHRAQHPFCPIVGQDGRRELPVCRQAPGHRLGPVVGAAEEIMAAAAIGVGGASGKGDGGVWSGNMDAGFMAIAISILISGLFWLWGARYLERDTAHRPAELYRLRAAP